MKFLAKHQKAPRFLVESIYSKYKKVGLQNGRLDLRVIRNFSLASKEKSFTKIGKKSLPLWSLGLALSITCITLFKYESDRVECDSPNIISVQEVLKHSSAEDCWLTINGNVYDVTKFLKKHPGGASRILKLSGKDATSEFSKMHSEEVLGRMSPYVFFLGKLDGEFKKELTQEEQLIEENMKNRPPIQEIFNLSDFEYVAKHVLPRTTFFYYATGSSDEVSLRENHYAYSRVYFRPKVLQDIGINADTSSNLLGNNVSLPIYITAFAGARFADPRGEKALQSAAYKANIMQMIPKLMSYQLEEFFEGVPADQNHWYQLHFDTQQELDNVEAKIKHIEKFPTIKGLFINVDLQDLGNREKDSKHRISDEIAANMLSTIANNGNATYPQRFSWKDIEKIRSMTKLPIALKGVQRGEDVVIAAEKGINGVILSNHGGRQLDFSRPPLEVLVEARTMLKEKQLENNIEIYLDGGIRRGSDIIKALCLGAKGVGLGRPFLYALGGYGEEGVSKLVKILQDEVQNNMRLLGVNKIEDLTEELVDISNLKFRSAVVNDVLYNSAYEALDFPRFRSSDGSN